MESQRRFVHELKAKDEVASCNAATTQTNITERMDAMEKRLMGVLGLVQNKLAEQDGTLAKLSAFSPPLPHPEASMNWTEVVKNPKTAVAKAKPKNQVKAVWKRPLAIIVIHGKEQFPELPKTIRQKMDPGVTETAISKMRQTRIGSLLIEISGGADSADTVKAKVKMSLEPNFSVRLTEDSLPVEVQDLDGITTRKEVLEAIVELGDSRGAKLVSLSKSYGGA